MSWQEWILNYVYDTYVLYNIQYFFTARFMVTIY
jgi:hypothetical protein